jgi:iron complex outermembrane recepter protein
MRNDYLKPSKLALCVALAIGSTSSLTLAEDNILALEEIVVYAQKREQSIMEVPIAVSTYNGDAIEKAQVRDAGDLQQLAPSLSVNTSSGSSDTSFTIRGIGTAGNNAGFEQSVGVFIDGVYRGRAGSALTDYVDIDGIEILKGPQGSLFGRNTSAGVINVRTKMPSYESSGFISASAGNEGYRQFKGSSTGAVIDDVLAYRVSGSWQERDGFYENIVNGDDINNRDRYSLRSQLLWDINEDASLRLIADYTKTDENCCAAAPIFYGPGAQLLQAVTGATFLDSTPGSYESVSGGYVDSFDRKVAINTEQKETLKDWGLSGELNWDFGETALTVLAAYRESETRNTLDADFTAADFVARDSNQDIDEASLEIRWASTGVNTMDWTLGLFYFNQNIDYHSPLSFGADAHDYFDVLSLYAANDVLTDALYPLTMDGLVTVIEDSLGQPLLSEGDHNTTTSDYNAESIALFGQATWNIDEQLSVTLGLRYSREEKTADYTYSGNSPFHDLTGTEIYTAFATSPDPAIAALATTPVLGPITGGEVLTAITQNMQQGLLPYDDFSSDYDDNNLSGTVSVNYIWNEELSTYARFAKGYKAGGLNQDRTAGNQQPGDPTADPNAPLFDPETVNSFEVGFKSRWLDNRLQLNGAIFYQQMDDFQFQEFNGTGFVIQNAAKVDGKGIELDYSFQPDTHWLFTGGITLQSIEYGEFESGPTTLAQELADQEYQDLSGEDVISTSNVSYSGSISYTHPLGNDLEWRAGTTYSYRSAYYTHESNEPILKQDSTLTINAVLTLASQDERWAVDLWGRNITDEEQSMVGFGTTFQDASYSTYVNAGPTWGVTGRLNF